VINTVKFLGDLTVAENDKTIVSRIQHRRGLKQDLPQPLRPGEIGLATDSRQIYIGGDPSNPASADYHSVSYFENTLSAKEHTRTIANNNIVAFNVPAVRFVEGEFNGTSSVKSWQPVDARSIIDVGGESNYSSSKYPVFPAVQTNVVSSSLSATKAAGSLTIQVTGLGGQDPLGNIRFNDEVVIDGYTGQRPKVTNVVKSQNNVDYDVTIDRSIFELPSGTSISFIPRHFNNIFTGQYFKSTDVTVVKNSLELNPEEDPALVLPSASAEYAIDASNVSLNGIHSLTFRSAPTTRDNAALTYYSNANVIAAIKGVESGTKKGNVSAYVTFPSFYQNKDLWPATNGVLPSYKHFAEENVRVSKSTGVGYVGMDLIHISSTADGANLTNTSGLTLGNLYIARDDQRFDISNVSTSDSGESYVINFTSVDDADTFVTTASNAQYKYDHVLFIGQSTANTEDEYFHRSIFPVSAHTSGQTSVTIAMPLLPFKIGREATASLKPGVGGNGYQNTSPGVTEVRISDSSLTSSEIKAGDWVRIVDTTSGADTNALALHDRVFEVLASRDGSFDIRLDSNDILLGNTNVTTFNGAVTTAGNIKYINHGNNDNLINTSLQIHSVNHGINPGGTTNVLIKSAVVFPADDYDINTGSSFITSNTFYVENYAYIMPTGNILATEVATGGLVSSVGDEGIAPRSLTSYGSTAFEVVPVLSIDLSNGGSTTVDHAIASVNRNLVNINNAGANVQIYPQMNWIPQDDGTKNSVYISQRPAYSSVQVGGLEFSLFEDNTVPTLAPLGLREGLYDRANNTVRAKFESWLNDLVNSRDVNLISNAFPTGERYATLSPISANNTDSYNLTIDNTFNEITFGSREEAGIFNNIVNRVYGSSLYDKLQDVQGGSRGLVNLKNNIEISTREAASFGNKVTSYNSMEEVLLLPSDDSTKLVASFDASSTYNVFHVDYSIQEVNSTSNKYIRTGTWTIAGRTDFTDSANSVIFNDNFSSLYEITSHSDDVVEPKFDATMNPESQVEIRMVDDQLIISSGTPGYDTHNLGVQLKIKYVVTRWSSIN
jgi:hypothetical protein